MSTAARSSKAWPNVSAANLATADDGRPVTSAAATNSSMNCVFALRRLTCEILRTIGPKLALLHECACEAREGAYGSG